MCVLALFYHNIFSLVFFSPVELNLNAVECCAGLESERVREGNSSNCVGVCVCRARLGFV